MRRPLAIIVLVLAAAAGALGSAPPAHAAAARYPGQGRHRRRRDARRHRELSAIRRRCLRRGHQVHAERRQGLQPECHLVEGQVGRGRRVDPHLLRSRQRLAEPVHVRPEVHDQGRHGPQRRPERRRQAVRLREQVLRRALRQDPRPRAERDRAAPSPVLCVGQLRARPRAADRHGRAPADQQLRGRVPRSRMPRPCSPTAIADRSTTSARCSPPIRRSRRCGGPRRATTATSSSFTSTRTSGVKSLMDPEGSSSGFYRSLVTHPTLTTNQVDRHRRHQPRPVDAGGARPGFGPRRGRATVARRRRRPPPARPTRARPRRSALACAHSPGRRRRPPALLSSRSRGSTTRPSTGSCASADLQPSATAHRRGSSRWIRRRRSSRRTATAWPTRSTLSAALSESAAWRSASATPMGRPSTRSPVTASAPSATWDGARRWRAGHRGHVHLSDRRDRCVGECRVQDRLDHRRPDRSDARRRDARRGRRRPGSRRTATASARRWPSAGRSRNAARSSSTFGTQDGAVVRSFSVPTATNVAAVTWDGKASDGVDRPGRRLRRPAHPARRRRQPRDARDAVGERGRPARVPSRRRRPSSTRRIATRSRPVPA